MFFYQNDARNCGYQCTVLLYNSPQSSPELHVWRGLSKTDAFEPCFLIAVLIAMTCKKMLQKQRFKYLPASLRTKGFNENELFLEIRSSSDNIWTRCFQIGRQREVDQVFDIHGLSLRQIWNLLLVHLSKSITLQAIEERWRLGGKHFWGYCESNW